MGKREQIRFYDVSEFFQDDERLMAWGIVDLLHVDIEAEVIYRDLLDCKYRRWIDYLEQITNEVTHLVLKEYCAQKEFEFDMMSSNVWSVGDFTFVEWKGWKLTSGDEEE